MSRLALYLLGPPRLERDGEPLQFDTRKILALVAYLAVTGATHTREALITLLWPELEPSRARAVLRRNLSLLGKALGGKWLVVDREIIGLDPDADPSTGSGQAAWVDVDQFRQHLAACETHGHPPTEACPKCVPLLEEAAALYRDHFLAGFTLRDSAAFDEWQFFETEGLKDQLASVLVRLASYHTSQGDFEAAVAHARRWLALDPLHEPAHRHLMELYAQAGQRSAALRQYEECERILAEELDLPLSEETTSLYEQIRTGPAERRVPSARPRHNLPAQSTPFIGREGELAEIAIRLSDPPCRLLTLVGPGGSGKTRLALEAAMAQLDEFEHGVYFVSLAPLRSIDGIVPTIAEAIGFSFFSIARYGAQIESRQQLLDHLHQKRMLLLLDSFEHLLDGAELVTQILERAPGVKVLVTSRAGLRMQGEHLFPVGGMGFPKSLPGAVTDAAQYSAINLFSTSARRVRPHFELGKDNLADVIQICRLVEGMPLAIVLAAVWTELLTPAEIAAEITRSLDFLEADLRDLPSRQRSVRAVFDHSWSILTEREREVLQALSVFRGGFARDAAQEIGGASLRELMALVNRSLLYRAPRGRYEVHELLRQYAEGKLDQSLAASEAARDRHSAYYATALQQWAEDLKGPRQRTALAEMEVEIENARAAWDWAVERADVERLGRAFEGLLSFYQRRGRYQEGDTACQQAADKLTATAAGEAPVLAVPPAPSEAEGSAVEGIQVKRLRVLARILDWQSWFKGGLRHYEVAYSLAQQGLEMLDKLELAGQDVRLEQASLLLTMGCCTECKPVPDGGLVEPTNDEMRQLYEQSLMLYRTLDDRRGTAAALEALGKLAHSVGAYDESNQLLEESLALRRALDDQWGVAASLTYLGRDSWIQGRLEEAERLLRDSLTICRVLDDQPSIAVGLVCLGEVLCRRGEFAKGCSLIEEGLTIGNIPAFIWDLDLWLCEAKSHLGEYAQARAVGQRTLAGYRETPYAWAIGFAQFVLGLVALAEEAYAEARRRLEESVTFLRGGQMPDNLAWALAASAYAARGLGELPSAEQYLSEALRIYAETGVFFSPMYGLPAAALLLADRGQEERAVELYALASRYGFVANSRWFEDVAGRHIAAVAATLPPDVVAAAQERGRARDLDATVAELLEELGG